MDEQSKRVLEKVRNNRGSNNFGMGTLRGGEWLENSSFIEFKNMSMQDIGYWGECMFEESFGIKSEPRGLDLPLLKADIKTFTRAYRRTKFSGGASSHLNPDCYFIYLIFPNEYQFYRIPSDDICIKKPKANGNKGKIDITTTDLDRFVQNGYNQFAHTSVDIGLERFF